MALLNDKLTFIHKEKDFVCARLADEIGKTSPSFVSVFYGEGVTLEQAGEMSERLSRRCVGAEVSLINGGQPVYSYLISAE